MSIPRTDFLQRIMHYCAEAERCSHDVLAKLVSWGISLAEAEIILEKLRKEKFLDDQRYAQSYVTEKWNLDKWGKLKIENNLKQKKINDGIIASVLSSIDEREYAETLDRLLHAKMKEASSGKKEDDVRCAAMFAAGRGFEEEMIQDWIDQQELDVTE